MAESARDRLRRILDYGGNKKSAATLAPSTRAAPCRPTRPSQLTRRPAGLSSSTRQPAYVEPVLSAQPVVTSPYAARSTFLGSGLRSQTPTILSQPTVARPASAPPGDLRLFLQELRAKMARLAEDFAQGKLNRKQFQEIYSHYQKQRQAVESAIVGASGADQWRSSIVTGTTGVLRERHAAVVMAYAIYDNTSSLPLASVGRFRIDAGLLIPMLSSFRSAATEIFGAGLRSTEIEGGRWLCFVPGYHTTLMVLFSVEPARVQLTLIEDLHRDFEVANRATLSGGRGREAAELFTRLWALDQVYPLI